MSVNSTQVSHFILSAYFHTGPIRYLYFVIVLILYVLIVFSNVLLILVIGANRSLHEPMYMFLCSLLVNELYGSTGLFPFLLPQILSDVHAVPAPLCFLQIFCLYSYGGVEFLTLAIMSYDRYLAICFPLRYHSLMTPGRIAKLTALIWLYPVLVNVFLVYGLTRPLPLCGNVINKVYCDRYYVLKLACGGTSVSNIVGLCHMFTVILSLILLIIYTYARILRVCCSGSKATRQRAVSTCAPHLASLVNFACGAFFEIVQGRLDLGYLPGVLRVVLSLYWLTMQPLVNPLMYGLRLSKIRDIYMGFVLPGKK